MLSMICKKKENYCLLVKNKNPIFPNILKKCMVQNLKFFSNVGYKIIIAKLRGQLSQEQLDGSYGKTEDILDEKQMAFWQELIQLEVKLVPLRPYSGKRSNARQVWRTRAYTSDNAPPNTNFSQFFNH